MDMFLPLFPLKWLEVQGLNESTLGDDVRQVAEASGVKVQADKEPNRNRFIRSDQYSFIKQGIPALAFKFGYLPGGPEEKTFKDWYTNRYHGVSDDASQPVDLAAAAQFNDILKNLALLVADASQPPHWNSQSFFRRFVKSGHLSAVTACTLCALNCNADDADLLSAELWEAGTAGIQELENGGGALTLMASFETNDERDELLRRFDRFSPAWIHENDTDWVQETKRAWPGQCVGTQLFLAPPWCDEATPPGRERVIHNPGLACGTGDHPCTQLALEALEQVVIPACSVADIGTGSGILAIAALRLGAATAFGMDTG